jgi:hypothetical protein
VITAEELRRIPKLLARKTKSYELAEDAMQDAIVRLLEQGHELTGARVHAYAKRTSLEGVRHEEMEHRKLAEFTKMTATHQGERLLTRTANTLACEVCGAPFQRQPNHPNISTCSRTCGYKIRSKRAKERGTHIARTH